MDIPRGATDSEIEEIVAGVVGELSLEEKVYMMSGHGFFAQMKKSRAYCDEPYRIGGGNERLGIPSLRFADGPRGVVTGGGFRRAGGLKNTDRPSKRSRYVAACASCCLTSRAISC